MLVESSGIELRSPPGASGNEASLAHFTMGSQFYLGIIDSYEVPCAAQDEQDLVFVLKELGMG